MKGINMLSQTFGATGQGSYHMIVRPKNILKMSSYPLPRKTFTHISIVCCYDFKQMCILELAELWFDWHFTYFLKKIYLQLCILNDCKEFSQCVRGETQMNVPLEMFTSDPFLSKILSMKPGIKTGKGVQCGGPCPWPRPYRKHY